MSESITVRWLRTGPISGALNDVCRHSRLLNTIRTHLELWNIIFRLLVTTRAWLLCVITSQCSPATAPWILLGQDESLLGLISLQRKVWQLPLHQCHWCSEKFGGGGGKAMPRHLHLWISIWEFNQVQHLAGKCLVVCVGEWSYLAYHQTRHNHKVLSRITTISLWSFLLRRSGL